MLKSLLKKVVGFGIVFLFIGMTAMSCLGMNVAIKNESNTTDKKYLTSIESELHGEYNDIMNGLQFKIYFLFGQIDELNLTEEEESFDIQFHSIRLLKVVIEKDWISPAEWEWELSIAYYTDCYHGIGCTGFDVETKGIFRDNFICGFIIIRYNDSSTH